MSTPNWSNTTPTLHASVSARIRPWVRCTADADDVASEALLRVARYGKRVSNTLAYSVRCAQQIVLKRGLVSARRPAVFDIDEQEQPAPEPPRDELTIADRVLDTAHVVAHYLCPAIAQLSKVDRSALLRQYWGEDASQACAAHRARRRLGTRLERMVRA